MDNPNPNPNPNSEISDHVKDQIQEAWSHQLDDLKFSPTLKLNYVLLK